LATERLRQIGREARSSSASVTLVLASVLSACAAVAGLTLWVSVAAAIAAVLSGCQVLNVQLVVPLRIRSAENATARVICRRREKTAEPRWMTGTGFQISARRWVTAQHIIDGSVEIVLKIGREELPARVLYQASETDLAVLSASNAFGWRASITRSLPEPGDRVKAIGWTYRAEDRPALRMALDYVVHGAAEGNLIAVTGPDPQVGFSGAPAIDVRSGRVMGVLIRFSRDSDSDSFGPRSADITFIRPISDIPTEYRGAITRVNRRFAGH